jgi:hypothetical protein
MAAEQTDTRNESQKKPYERPELLQYGSLDDVTRLYNYSPCGGWCTHG